MGYKYTLVLSREISDDESAILRKASPGCADAVFGPDTLPTNAEIPVTKMDVDDTVSPTLAEAIQAGLDAVKNIAELGIPGLTVPAQPAGPVDEDTPAVDEDTPAVVEGAVVEVVAEETLEPDQAEAERADADQPTAENLAEDPVEAGAGPA